MKKFNGMYFGLDVDGTVFTHDYPKVGKPLPNCIETLKRISQHGGRFCLNTMRSGKELNDAVEYLKDNGIELFGINYNPSQSSWTKSTKVYAHIYLDDAALGCPLTADPTFSDRPFVDWFEVERLLFEI